MVWVEEEDANVLRKMVMEMVVVLVSIWHDFVDLSLDLIEEERFILR